MASEDLPANGHGGPADPAKADRRRSHRAARRAYVTGLEPDRRREQEASLEQRLARNVPLGVIASYRATGSEIRPPGFGIDCLFPQVVIGAPLTFSAEISELTCSRPDIILVPLIAVDRRGNRLGQGGGHYDRTLAALRAVRPIIAIGLAWDMQLVDHLSCDPWDEPLDALATPTQWLTFPRSRPMSPE